MAMFLKVLTMVLVNVNLTTCARILCFFPLPMYSHQSFFQPIWRTLSERGHDVTVITPNPLKNSTLTTLREIDVSFTHKLYAEALNMEIILNTENNIWSLMQYFYSAGSNVTIEQMKSQGVQELIKNNDERFDLLIYEVHVPGCLAFARIYDCPVVGMSSLGTLGYTKSIMGDLRNPVLSPDINVPYAGQMNFFERLASVAYELFDDYQRLLMYLNHEKFIREILNDPHVNLFEIARNVSLLLSYSIPGFTTISPIAPSILPLSGLHITPPKDLPEDIQKFLDGAEKGAIYVSFGSNVKSYLMSEERKQIFIDVFKELAFRVLWKCEVGLSGLPENVKTVAWAPQQDVLRHKNIKLFITHGGITSIEEAIRFKVPMLGCPFYADQFQNTLKIDKLNLGSRFDLKSLTKEGLKKAILEVMNNNSIRESLEEISGLMKDPSESLDKAIWAIEYVIKYKGAKYLQSPLKEIPLYQQYLLDILLVFVVILLLIFWSLLRCFRFLTRACKKTDYKIKRQ